MLVVPVASDPTCMKFQGSSQNTLCLSVRPSSRPGTPSPHHRRLPTSHAVSERVRPCLFMGPEGKTKCIEKYCRKAAQAMLSPTYAFNCQPEMSRWLLKPSGCCSYEFASLSEIQVNTGSIPTKAAPGTPSKSTATSQQEGRRASSPTRSLRG
jgi:hypothetical protein